MLFCPWFLLTKRFLGLMHFKLFFPHPYLRTVHRHRQIAKWRALDRNFSLHTSLLTVYAHLPAIKMEEKGNVLYPCWSENSFRYWAEIYRIILHCTQNIISHTEENRIDLTQRGDEKKQEGILFYIAFGGVSTWACWSCWAWVPFH